MPANCWRTSNPIPTCRSSISKECLTFFMSQ